MKELNKRGFTLIELLAVIVILAVLLAIAIPAVAKYINQSKKATFVENAQSYAKAARSEALLGSFEFPINNHDAVVVSFKNLEDALENGGIKSSYGGTFDANQSFVVIVNAGTPEAPKNEYYIAACDSKGYGIGLDQSGTLSAAAIAYDDLKETNILQLGLNGTSCKGIAKPTQSDSLQTINGIPYQVRVTNSIALPNGN